MHQTRAAWLRAVVRYCSNMRIDENGTIIELLIKEALEQGETLSPRFDANGLIAAVTTDADTGEVLMLAWMNQEAVRETLATGQVCYWSRSRGRLWRKGETSGQLQKLQELRVDCDGDTLLLLVDQQGVACHTGTGRRHNRQSRRQRRARAGR